MSFFSIDSPIIGPAKFGAWTPKRTTGKSTLAEPQTICPSPPPYLHLSKGVTEHLAGIRNHRRYLIEER
jgi:hypothetical protein